MVAGPNKLGGPGPIRPALLARPWRRGGETEHSVGISFLPSRRNLVSALSSNREPVRHKNPGGFISFSVGSMAGNNCRLGAVGPVSVLGHLETFQFH